MLMLSRRKGTLLTVVANERDTPQPQQAKQTDASARRAYSGFSFAILGCNTQHEPVEHLAQVVGQ